MEKKQQRGNVNFIAIVLIAVVLALGGYFLLRKNIAPSSTSENQQSSNNQQTSNSQNEPSNTSIKNDSDLANTSNDLDKTDIDTAIDPELNQNTTDVQTFAPRLRLKNGTSLNWAGYTVETNLTNPQSNAVSDVKGSWVIPNLTCTSTHTYSASWIGIDGYSDNSVEQTGTEQDCINGQPSYSAWYEMYPKPSFRVNLPVKAGDTMSAEVQYVNNKFVLTLTDTTTKQTFTTTQKSNAQRQSAEWIVEAPWSGSILPLANFGTMSFSGAQATLNANTGTISNSSWQNDAITMTTSSGTAKATPSSLSSGGSNFSIIWNSN